MSNAAWTGGVTPALSDSDGTGAVTSSTWRFTVTVHAGASPEVGARVNVRVPSSPFTSRPPAFHVMSAKTPEAGTGKVSAEETSV
jgi:hypothetical protein